MKNVPKPKPKFLHCFRPVVNVDMVLEPKGVRIVEKKENKNSLYTKTMSLDRGCSVKSENTTMPPRPNRTFSRAIKAVVFETILAKRARDRKGYRQDSFGSKSFSVKSEASLNLGSDELMKVEETKNNLETSHSSSPSSLSSLSSSISRSSSILESKRLPKNLLDSTKQSIKHHQDPAVKSKKMQMNSSDFNSGIYFLLISLAITVFWGRVFAILVASIWFYFFQGRYNASNVKPENVRKWSKAECREDKKKVIIMEGLIERKNHHSHRESGGH